MSDTRLSDLTAISSLATGDLLYIDDVSEASAADRSKKLTIALLDARYQALDADLTAIGALAKTDGNIIVGDGSTWVAENGATARTSLGLGTADTPTFAALALGGANGLDVNPGSDIDADLLTVGVTGAPRLWWDESADAFIITKNLQVVQALAVGRSANAFGMSSNYPSLIVGDLSGADAGNGGLYAIGRYTKANEPFTGLCGWDSSTQRILYFGGGSWGCPDATRLYFYTAPAYNETNNAGVARMQILENGQVSIWAGTSPTGVLHVKQDSLTGSKPPLTLEQADISEDFVRFIGTSANGVLTQSIVDDADLSTRTLVGWLKIYVKDDGDQLTDGVYYVPFYSIS